MPDGCGTALDAGCGDGLLTRKLAARVGSVTGVDRSPEMIELARAHAHVPGSRWSSAGVRGISARAHQSSSATVNVSRWSASQVCMRSQRSHPPRSASAWR
ncbi:class I SAM-dependent methyltransferase [Streptomyces sp. NPDC019990]|uniref:class I SAM-dependent methyltransferase n=1 Tax=Streptomyces sp. NPDC019990 TaxID=3154693 RepID=UPI0033CDFAA1